MLVAILRSVGPHAFGNPLTISDHSSFLQAEQVPRALTYMPRRWFAPSEQTAMQMALRLRTLSRTEEETGQYLAYHPVALELARQLDCTPVMAHVILGDVSGGDVWVGC